MGISNAATIKKALKSLLAKQGGRYLEIHSTVYASAKDGMRFNTGGYAGIGFGHENQSKACALNKLLKVVKSGVHQHHKN